MKKLKISKDFTVDDIHKVREYHQAETKHMNATERQRYYAQKTAHFLSLANKRNK